MGKILILILDFECDWNWLRIVSMSDLIIEGIVSLSLTL
jgi:hypothetical protein